MQKAVDTTPNLGIIIVAYGNTPEVKILLDQILAQKIRGDSVVVIDNHPDHATADMASSHPAADIVEAGENIGFAAACNLAAALLPAEIELILLLNPDIALTPLALSAMRRLDPAWAASSGLILLPSGTINAEGNVLHISGLAWCDGLERPAPHMPHPRPLKCLSGACLLIRRHVWNELGGFATDFFMYYEDIDLSMRLSLAGHQIGLQSDAVFIHDYSFTKGDYKWFYLERNRILFMLRTWPFAVLLFLSPFLLLIEAGLWLTALLERRARVRVRAVASAIRLLPTVFRQRKVIQSHSQLSPRSFWRLLSPTINTPVIKGPSTSWTANRIYSMIYAIGQRLLP